VVFLVSPKSKHLVDEVDGCPLMGRCDYERSRIYISKALDDSAREDTLWHELLHALLHVTGADRAYRGGHKADEHIVGALTPVMHRLLKDLGFRFPRGPYI
jgi:hypothetical protein